MIAAELKGWEAEAFFEETSKSRGRHKSFVVRKVQFGKGVVVLKDICESESTVRCDVVVGEVELDDVGLVGEASGSRADTRLITLFNSEAVTDLHLDHRPIPEEGAVALAKTLPAHDETESLSLINTSLEDNAARHIGEVLEKLSIKSLNLSRNKITSVGAQEIAKGIATNASLTELNLEDNLIDDAGVSALAANLASKPAITLVNLNGNKITATGARSLVEHLSSPERSLPYLRLARNQLGDAGASEIAHLLSSNPTIAHVNLAGNGIGDKGVQALASSLANVIELDLADNNLTTQGVLALENALQSNRSLARVNLSNNKSIQGSEGLSSLFKDGFAFPSLALVRD